MKVNAANETLRFYLPHILNKLMKSHFIKNVLVVMTGTAGAQAIGFALSPIISRLYSPSDFGVFGSFNAVLGVIAAGLTLDYSQALMLPKQKDDAINLFMLSCVSTTIITVFCAIVCLLASTFIQNIIKSTNVWIMVLLVVGILVSGLNQACQAWCVRVKAFKHTSASQVIRSLSSSGAQVGLGYFQGGSLALIFAAILGEILASLNMASVVFRDLRSLCRDIRWDRMWSLSKDYRDFPIYSASMNVINSLSLGLPVLLLTHFYGIAVGGAYAFGVRILSAPMGLVLRALRQVLFQKASETHNDGDRLLPLYIKITLGLFCLSVFPVVVFFIWAPQIFTWIFGSQWQTAGEFAKWMVLWLMFMFCNLPSVLFARIIRIQDKMFLFDMALLALRALSLIVGGTYMSALNSIMLFSMVSAIMNIIFIVIVGYAVMREDGKISFDNL